jgi:hypothetical protein
MAFYEQDEMRFLSEKELEMRFARILSCAALAVLLLAGSAFAQFGLYGAPDPVRLPSAQPTAAPYGYQAYQPAPAYQPQPPSYPAARMAQTTVMYPTAGTAAQPGWQTYPRAGMPLAAAAPAAAPTPAAPTPAPQPSLVEPPESAVPAPGVAPKLTPIPAPAASPSPSDRPNLMNNMLSQPACGGGNGYSSAPAYGSGCGNGYSSYGYDANGGCKGGACAQYGQEAGGYGPGVGFGYSNPWYAGANVLVLGRDRPNGQWLSYRSDDATIQLFNSRDLEAAWQWGGEITFGRRFACDQFAVQATYWTLSPTTATRSVNATPGVYQVSTPLNTQFVTFGVDPIQNWFDGADQHLFCRTDEYHNVEVNVLCNAHSYDPTSCRQPLIGMDWLMGFRYFRAEDSLKWQTLRMNGSWNTAADWATLNDRLTNNLWGFQVGANADLRLSNCFKIFCNPRFGVYNNHIEQVFSLTRGDQVSASGLLGNYPVSSQVDKLSFLSEVSVGVDWKFAHCWSAQIGYRVIAATGMGLADHQIPFYLVDVPEIAHLDTNGHLILHGAFAGITYNF